MKKPKFIRIIKKHQVKIFALELLEEICCSAELNFCEIGIAGEFECLDTTLELIENFCIFLEDGRSLFTFFEDRNQLQLIDEEEEDSENE